MRRRINILIIALMLTVSSVTGYLSTSASLHEGSALEIATESEHRCACDAYNRTGKCCCDPDGDSDHSSYPVGVPVLSDCGPLNQIATALDASHTLCAPLLEAQKLDTESGEPANSGYAQAQRNPFPESVDKVPILPFHA